MRHFSEFWNICISEVTFTASDTYWCPGYVRSCWLEDHQKRQQMWLPALWGFTSIVMGFMWKEEMMKASSVICFLTSEWAIVPYSSLEAKENKTFFKGLNIKTNIHSVKIVHHWVVVLCFGAASRMCVCVCVFGYTVMLIPNFYIVVFAF